MPPAEVALLTGFLVAGFAVGIVCTGIAVLVRYLESR